MKRSKLNRYSDRKIAQIRDEAEVRVALCKRAGGQPIPRNITIRRKDKVYELTTIACIGGICECGLSDCPKTPPDGQTLEPHEKLHRSLGGKLSMNNSIMVRRDCHIKLQNNEPKWDR